MIGAPVKLCFRLIIMTLSGSAEGSPYHGHFTRLLDRSSEADPAHKTFGVVRGSQLYKRGHQSHNFVPSYWQVWPRQCIVRPLTSFWLSCDEHFKVIGPQNPTSCLPKLVNLTSSLSQVDEFLTNFWQPLLTSFLKGVVYFVAVKPTTQVVK